MSKCVTTSLTLLVLAGMLFVAPAFGQEYVGDQACAGCHANMPSQGFFEGYMNSGHPWKIFRTEGADPAVDTWPHTPVPPLPSVNGSQLLWSDVEYVIGNFYWKTRFIRPDGFIYTGSATDLTQWNVLTEEFVPYNAGTVDKPFDCGRCHTTGYDAEGGNQHSLPGLIGTWTEDGVRCEACHGPASGHAASPSGNPPPGGKDCADCHFRDAQFRMPWKGGFMRHHQQSEDLSHSPHDSFECTACHNPHRSVVYDDGGTIANCDDAGCHVGSTENNFYVIPGKESFECYDCHMPFMGKSGQSFNAYTGDIRGHLFRILTSPTAAVDNTYQVDGSTFWNQDVNGESYVTLDYACLGCHETQDINWASTNAMGMHNVTPVKLAYFQAERGNDGVSLTWRVDDADDHAGFHVYRETREAGRVQVSRDLLAGNVEYRFVDGQAPGGVVDYWLAELSRSGGTEWHGPVTVEAASAVQPVFAMAPAWPNPFGAEATVSFTLPERAPVKVTVYDTNGRLVRTLLEGVEAQGEHVVTWNGQTDLGGNSAAGLYLIRLETSQAARVQKIVYAP